MRYNIPVRFLIENTQKSIYDPSFYREIPSRPLGYALKYFVALSLLLSFVVTFAYSLSIVPAINDALPQTRPFLLAHYPDELEIRIEKGNVSTNVTEPYRIPMPPEWSTADSPANLLVIDTAAPITKDAFDAYDTAGWLAKDTVAFADDFEGMTVDTIPPDLDFTMNEKELDALIAMVEPYFGVISPAIVAAILLFALFGMLFDLLYLFIGAFFIFLLGHLMRQYWTYGESYRIGLHALTLTLVVNVALRFFGVGLGNFPFLATVIMLVVVYMNFKDAPKKSAAAPSVAPTPPPPPPAQIA